jgi:serine/threonine-protein kinase
MLLELAKGGPVLRLEISIQGCTHSGNPPGNLFCIHCGAPVKVERTIHQYLILRTLGKGGMGTTYLACERPTTKGKPPQLLVVKEMNADMAKIAKARELFEREARILQGLNHAGIPKFFDFFVEENKKYLAMELIHGQDLERKIYERGPVLPAIALEWMIQTCEVLEYIHSQIPPIIHRDIKPANLMVRHIDNRVVVLDFGAVKEIGTPLGTRIGAPDYSAPEQNRGQPLTQSDLYAIGPTLIFLLTGQSPHQYYGRRGQEYRFNVENVPTITPKLRSVIDRVTEPKPNNRYQTARELSKALAACL